MGYIADDIICDAPAGRLEGAAAYRAFMGPFAQIVTCSEMIAAFGDLDSSHRHRPQPGNSGVPAESGMITRRRPAAGAS